MNSNYFVIRKVNVLLLLLSFLFCEFTFSQSPYELHYKKDIPLLSASLIGYFAGRKYISNNVDALTVAQVNALDRANVHQFDRSATFNYSQNSIAASNVILFSSYALPTALFLDKNIKNDFLTITVMGLETFYVSLAATKFTKGIRKRTRPFLYNPEAPLEDKLFSSGRLSFYSGHTSKVASLSFFMAKVYADYHPDSKWKPLAWSAATLVSGTTAYLRYHAGKHFPTDVLTGMATGALFGILIPHLHRKKRKKQKASLSVFPSGDQLGLVLRW